MIPAQAEEYRFLRPGCLVWSCGPAYIKTAPPLLRERLEGQSYQKLCSVLVMKSFCRFSRRVTK